MFYFCLTSLSIHSAVSSHFFFLQELFHFLPQALGKLLLHFPVDRNKQKKCFIFARPAWAFTQPSLLISTRSHFYFFPQTLGILHSHFPVDRNKQGKCCVFARPAWAFNSAVPSYFNSKSFFYFLPRTLGTQHLYLPLIG